MPDLRQTILDRLEELDKRIAWLADHEDVHCSRRAVYNFLREGAGISADTVGQMLDVLKLQVKPGRGRPK